MTDLRAGDERSLGEQLQAAGVTVPLRVGHDGELLDANGNCHIVVDPNREIDDDAVRVISKAIVAAVNERIAPVTPAAVAQAAGVLRAFATLIERPPLDDVLLEKVAALRVSAAIPVILAAVAAAEPAA